MSLKTTTGWVTLKVAGERLGVSPSTLRWQVRNGKLKAHRVGTGGRSYLLVTNAEVERYRRDHLRVDVLNPPGVES